MTVDAPPTLLTDDTTARRVGAIRRDITWLMERWVDLQEVRLKGTTRPWRQPTLTPDQRAALDDQARVERHERSATVLGEHPAPVHVDVVDVLDDIAHRVNTLHEHVADTIDAERTPLVGRWGGTWRHLRFIHTHLITAVHADPDMLDAAADTIRTVREAAARQLGELYDGQTLAGVCPFCHGRTPEAPTGGARTLRVRLVPLATSRDPDHREPAVVCGNDLCTPNEHQCGLWHAGHPAWPMVEWAWLANLLTEADAG